MVHQGASPLLASILVPASTVTKTIITAYIAAERGYISPSLMKGGDENRRGLLRADCQLFVVVIDDRLTAAYRYKGVPRPRVNLGHEMPGRYTIPRVGHVALLRYTPILMVARDREENIVIPRFGAGYFHRCE